MIPLPVGVLTVMIPLDIVHVGCVTEAVGVAGVDGCGLIVINAPALIHPSAFFAVTVYVPAAKEVKFRDD